MNGQPTWSLINRPFKAWAMSSLLAALCGCVSVPQDVAPHPAVCPEGVPAQVRCLRGQDGAGAHYLIAVPARWSGVLVVHAHGGPSLGEPKTTRADEDIRRWAITLAEGHAWAGSVFRQGGLAVTKAAEDTERVRQIFVEHVAKPRVTLLHGQSWGGMVATRAAERYPHSWDGMLLTSGIVAGPSSYDFRLDLRAIYQYLCNNHPRPQETPYPLSIGLPTGSTLTHSDLIERADECLGTRRPASKRSPEQARKLKTIVDVIKIPESSVVGHLQWGTFSLQDLVLKNGGESPLGNEGVRYTGSNDDAALNAGVPRWRAEPTAVARFAADSDHSGHFRMPVISAHAVGDPTVFVESEDTLLQRMQAAGQGARLVQAFVDSREHSYWGDAMYPPLFNALLKWVQNGQKPSPQSIAAECVALRSKSPQDCLFRPEYTPKPLGSRIAPR